MPLSAGGLPAPIRLVHELAPALEGLSWGVGGSALLWRLGLETAPRDLDIVVAPEHADAAAAALDGRLERLPRPSHADYASEVFIRYRSPSGVELDLMAGIAVRRGDALLRWHFDPRRVTLRDGLPFMAAEDWLALYRMFGRPARVARLSAYLGLRDQGSSMM